MTLTKKEINQMWNKAKKGIYYDNEDLKKNNGETKGLQKYNFEGEKIN